MIDSAAARSALRDVIDASFGRRQIAWIWTNARNSGLVNSPDGLNIDEPTSFIPSTKYVEKPMSDYLKLYIAVLDNVPDHMVPVLVAHSILGAHFKFSNMILPEDCYQKWKNDSFRKVVIRVSHDEFVSIIKDNVCFVGHENTVNGGAGSCVIPLPVWHSNVPPVLKFAKLWKPKESKMGGDAS